jgi:hypothetical protein
MSLFGIAILAGGLALDGSVRGEGRAGTAVPGQGTGSGSFAADVSGQLSGPDGVVRLGLAPSAVLARDDQFFGAGTLEAALRLSAGSWLRLRQRLGYGVMDLSPLSAPASSTPPPVTAPVQPPPGSRFLTVQESSTSLDLDLAVARRLKLEGSVGWNVSGGADAASRAELPLSRGPRVRASGEWAATPLDSVRGEINAVDATYSNGRRASVGTLTGGWRTALSRSAELLVALGPGVARSRIEGAAAKVSVYGVAAADCRIAAASGLSVAMGLSIEPLGDPLTGEVVERGSVRGSATWGLGRIGTATASVAASLAITTGSDAETTTQAGDRYVQGELGASFPVTGRSTVGIGLRAISVSRPFAGQPQTQWSGFAAFTAHLPQVR